MLTIRKANIEDCELNIRRHTDPRTNRLHDGMDVFYPGYPKTNERGRACLFHSL